MHGDGDVARDRLGARGFDLDELAGLFDQLVAHVVKRAVGRLHDHFLVGEGGERNGAPVDETFAAVNVAALEELDEDGEDGLRVMLVHRERRARPVAGGAKAAELFEDDAALLVAPGPDLFEELVTAEVAAVEFLFAEFALDDGLRGDAGVVGAGYPEGGLALETGAADEDVLQGVVEHVAHRQDAGDVGRRDDDAIGLAIRDDAAGKAVGGLPGGIPLLFDVARFVALADFGHTIS